MLSDKWSPASPSYLHLDAQEHLPLTRKVRVSDAELIYRACNASKEIHGKRLLPTPSTAWDHKTFSGFTMLSRRMGGEDLEVLTTGEVACELNDVEALLYSHTETEYNAGAGTFWGDQFIYGSLVHEVQFPDESPNFDPNWAEKGASRQIVRLTAEDQMAVRTASFAHSRTFARNEEWCFLDHFRPHLVFPSPLSNSLVDASEESSGFSIVMTSLPESELLAGKMKKECVVQLHGIVAAYIVQRLPPTVGCRDPRVRVSFHATFTASNNLPEGYADSSIVSSRLLSLAKSLHRLPTLVQQRKRSYSQSTIQCSYSSRSGQEQWETQVASSSRCVACTKRLRIKHLIAPTRRSKRCQICMYRACASCWSNESVETFGGHTTRMVVCRRCHENFGTREYAHIYVT